MRSRNESSQRGAVDDARRMGLPVRGDAYCESADEENDTRVICWGEEPRSVDDEGAGRRGRRRRCERELRDEEMAISISRGRDAFGGVWGRHVVRKWVKVPACKNLFHSTE